MNNVIVALFATPSDAGKAMHDFERMVKKHRSTLLDVCSVSRDGSGRITLKQMFDRPDRFFVAGLCAGGLVGFLLGLSLFGVYVSPVTAFAGAIAGLGFAALMACMIDYGLDDHFIQQIGSELKTDSAAIVMLHPPGPMDAVLAELNRFPVTILQIQQRPSEQQALQETMAT